MGWIEFLTSKGGQILSFLLMIGIFVVSFSLWHLPLAALINPTLLALVVFLVYMIASYLRWRKIQERFQELRGRVLDLERKVSEVELTKKDQEDLIKIWSHQMKVPITALDLMSQAGQLDIPTIKVQVFTLESTLTTLLEISRIKNVSTDFYFEKVALDQLIREVIRKYAFFFIQKNLTVQIEGQGQLMTDKRWLGLVMEQILHNAIKYTEQGSILVKIEDRSIEIIDTGIGILKEDLPRLFDHGFMGFNGRQAQQKSTGLGLYLTKMILDKLDLKIMVDSQVGKGTMIRIFKD